MLTQFLEELYTASNRPHSDEFYRECLSEIEREQIAPQVLAILRQGDYVQQLPKDFFDGVYRLSQKTVGQNLYIRFQQQHVFNAFNRDKIPAITLKGIAFAERYFGDFTSRPTSDIDLFLTQGNLERAVECLRQLGFSGPHDYNPLHFHCVMSKPIHPGHDVLNVELHWSLVHENNASPLWDEFWMNASPLKDHPYIKELSVQNTFYTICLHGANHRLCSVKYLIDVAQIIYTHGDEIDFHRLFDACKRDRTLRRVKAVLKIVYAEFPGLHRCKALPFSGWGGSRLNRTVLAVPVLTPDSWRLRFRIVKEWLWPMREVAVWHLRNDPELTPFNVYRRFYRQRFIHVVRTMSRGSRTEKENELHA